MGGLALPVNWIEHIEITRGPSFHHPVRGPLFEPGQRLNLSKVTLLFGQNGAGKTALCEWLGAAADESHLVRWARTDLRVSLKVYNPLEHTFAFEISDGRLVFRLDGTEVPFNPLPIVVHVLSYRGQADGCGNAVLELADWLSVTPSLLTRLVEKMSRDGSPFVDSIEITDERDVVIKLQGMTRAGPLSALSGGERVAVAVALAMTRANISGLHAPTLLLLDDLLVQVDANRKQWLLRKLLEIERVQVLATFPHEDAQPQWGGWSVAHIRDGSGGSTISEA